MQTADNWWSIAIEWQWWSVTNEWEWMERGRKCSLQLDSVMRLWSWWAQNAIVWRKTVRKEDRSEIPSSFSAHWSAANDYNDSSHVCLGRKKRDSYDFVRPSHAALQLRAAFFCSRAHMEDIGAKPVNRTISTAAAIVVHNLKRPSLLSVQSTPALYASWKL